VTHVVFVIGADRSSGDRATSQRGKHVLLADIRRKTPTLLRKSSATPDSR
jgi:hypothetical protein